jgi:hypothetical protein
MMAGVGGAAVGTHVAACTTDRRIFSLSILGWSTVGVAGLLGTLWLHRWSRKPGREALAKRLEDGAAGGSLRRAQAELDALKA